MWPWSRWAVEPVLVDDGDDVPAALAMILRYHRRAVTLDEVTAALGAGVSAYDVVAAAERFGLRGVGWKIDRVPALPRLKVPCIAHLHGDRRSGARAPGPPGDGVFAVVVAVSRDRVDWIDPVYGVDRAPPDEFFAKSTGIFLCFYEATALPRARLSRPRRGSPG
jgi:ABC-type bacteriocin/lantibiotic exporter with double-glycine peptidase domain